MDHDPSYIAAMAVIVVFAVAMLIYLLPLLFQVVWQIMPGVLLLWLIVKAITGMLKGFWD
jgi:hypothetical protein